MVQETLEITDKQLVRRFRTQLRRNVPRNGATEGPNQREKNSRWRNREGNGTLRLRLLVQPRPRRQASHQRIRQRQTLNPRRPFQHEVSSITFESNVRLFDARKLSHHLYVV